MTKLIYSQPLAAPSSSLSAQPHKHGAQHSGCRAIAQRLGLSSLPVLLLVLSAPLAPVDARLWLAVALYGGLIAWASGGTLVKLVEMGAAVTLGSLALVTLGS